MQQLSLRLASFETNAAPLSQSLTARAPSHITGGHSGDQSKPHVLPSEAFLLERERDRAATAAAERMAETRERARERERERERTERADKAERDRKERRERHRTERVESRLVATIAAGMCTCGLGATMLAAVVYLKTA
eukprot:SAG31_NODE_3491_length_4203_cov_2.510478_4_plen_137_part_00